MKKPSNLKILHIASGDLWAGAESQLFTLVTTLHKTFDVTVYVILLNYGTLEKKLRMSGIEGTVLDESSMNGFQILRKLVRIIKDQHPDVIHTHRIKENILGSIAGFLARGVPSIRTTHGAPEHRPSWRQLPRHIIRALDRIAGKYLQHRIIAVSEDIAELLRHEFPPEKIHVIENGIDLKTANIHGPTSALDNRAGTLKIGIAGRLVAVKRVDIFIQTARYILDSYPKLKVEFYIIGDGPKRSELQNLSRELGTEDAIIFEGHCDDIINRLRQLDALLMTSDHEGLPMVLLEAMLLGVPIIAHAIGGIPALLDNGLCGIMIENHSPAGYAQAIHQLSLSQAYRTELTELAQIRVRSHYSAETNARKYLDQYYEIRRQA